MADFQRQAMLQRTIQRTLENFRKVGKDKLTIAKVQARISTLDNAWDAFCEGHVALANANPEEDQRKAPYFTENHFDSTEETYLNTKDAMLDALTDLESKVSPPPRPSGSIPSRPAISLSHLPPVQLTPFSGDCNEWETFRDRFKSLIWANRDLSDFTRMHYLISSLRGPALDAVSNLSITGDNLSIAWNALTKRFENKRRLIRLHLSNLIDLSPVKRESAAELHSLIDRANVAVTSLKKLGRSSEELWTDMLVHLVSQKLDPVTRKAWTLSSNESEAQQTFSDLTKFLESRARALDDLSVDFPSTSTPKSLSSPRVHAVTTAPPSTEPRLSVSSQRHRAHSAELNAPTSQPACPLCQSRHYLSSCSLYLAKSPKQRRETVTRFARCFNCLSDRHAVADCPSKYTCRVCQQTHHTSLHDDSESRAGTGATGAPRSPSPQFGSPAVASLSATTPRRPSPRVLLATVQLKVRSSSGRTATVRALLDQGSEVTLITENLAQLLQAKRFRRNVTISAVGGARVDEVRSAVSLLLSPVHSNTPTLTTTALVLPTLTSYHAHNLFDPSNFNHIVDLSWADPDPTSAEPIQVILGADVYSDVILNGIRKGTRGQLIAQNSIFGWVISGPIQSPAADRQGALESSATTHTASTVFAHHCVPSPSLESELRRFWEVEELPRCASLTSLERQCEDHFTATHSRTQDGRFVVRLPFARAPPLDLGQSQYTADRMFRSLARKLRNDPVLEREYSAFMREYETLGHMRRATAGLPQANQTVYIPHHPVFRPGSETTHLRVVFNASSPTSNGRSLNDQLLAGPKLQTDLPSVILKWRHHRYVYTADVAKMYRQILVDPRDLEYQRIIWQDESTRLPVDYVLLTVTYGMTCAPFLALRVIRRLVELEGSRFPLAIPILRDQIYVDDVLFGGDTLEILRTRRDHVIGLLRSGRFELRKWSSNSTSLLSDIDPSDHGLACTKTLAADDHVKVLGIGWNPSSDAFQIETNLPTTSPRTKRAILSAISKIYDPLGWLTPVTITAKILMQDLWRSQISWDANLPDNLQNRWEAIYSGLTTLKAITLPRWTGLDSHHGPVELHGFCDASSHAFAAVVYLKVTSASGQTFVSLLASKSKVAPLSFLSIPRLELSAALLLARLLEFVRPSLGDVAHSCFAWSDSTIVLAWLRAHPSRWKTFVANRVQDVHTRCPDTAWRYVPSADNPADCASRGLLGNELKDHPLWWSGPSWLTQSTALWPSDASLFASDGVLSEEKVTVSIVSASPDPWELASRFSSWPRLLRVTGYLYKFIRRCRQRLVDSPSQSPIGLALSVEEFATARTFWIKWIQRDIFPSEIHALANKQTLPIKSPLSPLNPFLDRDGCLRVGGRLRNAPLPFRQRHQIILAKHPLVKLIVAQSHLRTLHGGLQLTLSTLRLDFWILSARSLVKQVIHSCIRCVRERALVPTQLMGDLPVARVQPSPRSFLHSGVDYAGPVRIRTAAGRGVAARKAYIALFVCLATRAIHLELVGDYSTAAFLSAFSRFCSRRGVPSSMYSDNGTTFVGADRELARALRTALRDPAFQTDNDSSKISWHFIPPSAPHFGGLWEAGVRSVKHHLRRVLGDRTLTFEEFTTLLAQIEACLNSRPIAPLFDTLDNYEALTPGHFLIGSALTATPEPSLLHLNENRLSRWQLVRHMFERFWKLWQVDYVNTLQQRSRWRRVRPSLELGQLVLLRNSTLPPCKWELGRVTRLHPGPDGLTRVVTVRTAHSEFKRPIVQLCALPVVSETSVA